MPNSSRVVDQGSLATHLAERVDALSREALGTEFGNVKIALQIPIGMDTRGLRKNISPQRSAY